MPTASAMKVPITLSSAKAEDVEALVAIRIEAMRENLKHIERFLCAPWF
jgi:hypothetical protein